MNLKTVSFAYKKLNNNEEILRNLYYRWNVKYNLQIEFDDYCQTYKRMYTVTNVPKL